MSSHIHETYSEVFIIESLSLDDEKYQRFEGKILYDVLKMSGQNPKYYYFRTKDELVLLAQMFRESDFRFLHISCHGGLDYIKTTLDKISYSDFGKIFDGVLRNRRVFMSACSTGNELFSTVVFGRNKGMYSITAPKNAIEFSKAVGLWSAFYAKVFSTDPSYLKNRTIRFTIENLSKIFNVEFLFSYHDTWRNKIKHIQIR